LDPPLSLILDEAANYPLPSLSSLMSEGGGTGICTLVVLPSLAQARAVWGEHQAGAIWDSAIVKVILGGGSNARDLDDLTYQRLGAEDPADLMALCARDHARLHAVLDASPSWRRLGRAAATVGIIAMLRRSERAARAGQERAS
jgi:type IV secretion system protein VirD4